MAHWLRVLTALAEDPSSVPCTHADAGSGLCIHTLGNEQKVLIYFCFHVTPTEHLPGVTGTENECLRNKKGEPARGLSA